MNFYDNADMFREAASRPAYQKAPKNMPDPDPSEISPGDTESAEEFWQMHKNKHTEDHPAKGNQYGSEKVRRAPEPRPGVGISESHFEKGDKVKCLKSGMTGTVTKVDPEEKGKYYTVKRNDGKVMKYAPDELKALNEASESQDPDDSFARDAISGPSRGIVKKSYNRHTKTTAWTAKNKDGTMKVFRDEKLAKKFANSTDRDKLTKKESVSGIFEASAIEKKVAERIQKALDSMSSEDKAAFMKSYLKNPKAATEYMFSNMQKHAKGEMKEARLSYGRVTKGANKEMLKKAMEIGIADFNKGIHEVPLSKDLKKMTSGQDMKDQAAYFAAWQKGQMQQRLKEENNMLDIFELDEAVDQKMVSIVNKLQSGAYSGSDSRLKQEVNKDDVKLQSRGGDPFFVFGYVDGNPVVYGSGSGGSAIAGFTQDVGGVQLKSKFMAALKSRGYTAKAGIKRLTSAQMEDWINRSSGMSYLSPEDATVGPVMRKLKSGEYFRPESRYSKMKTLVNKKDIEMFIRGGDPFFIFGYIQEQPFVFAAGSGGGTALAGLHHDPDLKSQLITAIKRSGFTPSRQMMSKLGKGIIDVNPKRMSGKMIEDWIKRTALYESNSFMDVASDIREIMEAQYQILDIDEATNSDVDKLVKKLTSNSFFSTKGVYSKLKRQVEIPKDGVKLYSRGGDPFFIFGYVGKNPVVFGSGSGGDAITGVSGNPELKQKFVDAIKTRGFSMTNRVKEFNAAKMEDWINRSAGSVYENTFADFAKTVKDVMEARRYVSDPADDNMIMQLRKAQDLLDDKPDSATYELTFRGGKKGKIDKKSIDRLLSAHDRIPKSENKRRFRIMIMQSPEAMKKIANDPALN